MFVVFCAPVWNVGNPVFTASSRARLHNAVIAGSRHGPADSVASRHLYKRKTYKSVLISISVAARLHRETMDMELMHHKVWLFTSQLLLVLIAPTHGGMARLS